MLRWKKNVDDGKKGFVIPDGMRIQPVGDVLRVWNVEMDVKGVDIPLRATFEIPKGLAMIPPVVKLFNFTFQGEDVMCPDLFMDMITAAKIGRSTPIWGQHRLYTFHGFIGDIQKFFALPENVVQIRLLNMQARRTGA